MIIYKITNKLCGKSYVGQTTRNIKLRVGEHKCKRSLIGAALNQLGEENFLFEIVEYCSSQCELDEREAYWTEKLNTIHPNGYNKAIVASKYGEHNGFFGKKHNAETIEGNRMNQPNRKTVQCIDTGEVFVSVRECERRTGVGRAHIINVCKGKTRKAKGLRFQYI